jgi:hypothetical protein
MKNIVIGTVAFMVIMLTATSCKKANSVNGGTWTFKSQTYTVNSGIADITQNPTTFQRVGLSDTTYPINLTLVTVSKTYGYADIVFTFYTYPQVSGTYTLTPNAVPDSGSMQMAVQMITQTGSGSSLVENTYNPSPYSNVSANVTVQGNGWIKISLPAVEMVNANTPSDSSILTATVNQTQAPL